MPETAISAQGRDVVIIGGGDTGADCLGTALRQGAASVTQLEILPRPPGGRPAGQPWPVHPAIFRVSSAHEEGGDRVYAVSTQRFLADENGRVRALVLVEVAASGGGFQPVPGTERELPCDLVLLAMGFTGAEAGPLATDLGVAFDSSGQRRQGRRLRHVGAGRVRGRRRGPGPVADRLGDRGRQVGGGRGRHLPVR